MSYTNTYLWLEERKAEMMHKIPCELLATTRVPPQKIGWHAQLSAPPLKQVNCFALAYPRATSLLSKLSTLLSDNLNQHSEATSAVDVLSQQAYFWHQQYNFDSVSFFQVRLTYSDGWAIKIGLIIGGCWLEQGRVKEIATLCLRWVYFKLRVRVSFTVLQSFSEFLTFVSEVTF